MGVDESVSFRLGGVLSCDRCVIRGAAGVIPVKEGSYREVLEELVRKV